jgi:hypothetical protein
MEQFGAEVEEGSGILSVKTGRLVAVSWKSVSGLYLKR